MRIVLTGGGTGGHIIPLIAVAKKIKERNPDVQFIFIGPKGKLELSLMEKEGIVTRGILVGKARRYFSFLNFLDAFKIPLGILQALFWLLVYMPDAIFGKGGHASFPVVLVGWIYRIPILIHESDATPGVANTILGKFADRVAVSYPQAEKLFPAEQVVLTGNPLREDIAQGNPKKAREMYNIEPTKKVIFVVGGSLGAKSINDKILNILPDLIREYYIIHQTGESNLEEVIQKAGELGIKARHDDYYPIGFYGEEIKDILAVADLVISRAGGNTLAEIAANGKPSIVIPLDASANDHQRMNAYTIAKNGGCVVLEEANLGEHMVLSKIQEVMNDEELRSKMSQNIRAFYHSDAAERIAEGVLGMIKR